MPTSTIDTDTRNAMLDAANAELNDGGGANATYAYLSAGDVDLCVWNLNGTNPFTTAGSSTAGTSELTGEPIAATAIATDTATKYEIRDKAGTVRRNGNLSPTVAITSGSTYNLFATAVQPAS